MCNKWWNLPTFRFPRRWIAPRRVECERCTWFRWWTIVIRVKKILRIFLGRRIYDAENHEGMFLKFSWYISMKSAYRKSIMSLFRILKQLANFIAHKVWLNRTQLDRSSHTPKTVTKLGLGFYIVSIKLSVRSFFFWFFCHQSLSSVWRITSLSLRQWRTRKRENGHLV